MTYRLLRAIGPSAREAVNTLQKNILADEPCDPVKGWWWLIDDGEESVAFAGMTKSSRWHDTIYLCRAGVMWAHRGHGLQKRLIKAREAYARRLGYRWLITDTARENFASANSLVACGFRLYRPSKPFGRKGALYWKKRINP